MNNEKQDVYTRITDKIIADLEQGVRTWMKPWNAGNTAGRITRPLRAQRRALLRNQHPDALGGSRRAGLHRSHLDDLPPGNRAQCPCPQGREGLAGGLCQLRSPAPSSRRQGRGNRARNPLHEGLYRIQRRADRRPARAAITRSPRSRRRRSSASATPRHSLPQPRPMSATGATAPITAHDGDYIQMPVIEAFRDAESFYATLAHESAHWTKHPARLDRDFGRKQWGDEGYAREELVAELVQRFPLRRSGHHAGSARRPRFLYRHLAHGAQERQARHLQRRVTRTEGRGLSPRPPDAAGLARFG